MVFHGYIMTVIWFSDGQPSHNTMADIDTNMFNHVSTLFTTAGSSLKISEKLKTSDMLNSDFGLKILKQNLHFAFF